MRHALGGVDVDCKSLIRQMAMEQREALDIVSCSLRRDITDPEIKARLTRELNETIGIWNANWHLYDNVPEDRAECIVSIVESYREFLRLLLEEIREYPERLDDVLEDILEWIARAPFAFRLRLKNC